MWIPSREEIDSVIMLSASGRYEYLVKKVADQEALWSLSNDEGWVLASDTSGSEAVPIWPHEKFARMCATGNWAACEPQEIKLDVWMDHWIRGLERDRRLIAVFPTPHDKGACVEPSIFDADLRQELENY